MKRLNFKTLLNLKNKYYGDPVNEIRRVIHTDEDADPEQKQHDLEVLAIKREAEKIKATADKSKAENDLIRAQNDRKKIEQEQEVVENPPRVVPSEEQASIQPLPEQVPQSQPVAPTQVQQTPVPPQQTEDLNVDESVFDSEDNTVKPLELENLQELISEADFILEQGEPQQGQTKDEAEIAKIQAETEKIRAEAQTGGMSASASGDPMAAAAPGPGGMDPSMMGGGAIDPTTGMPMDPSMMGMGGGKPDPMAGFGDSTMKPLGGPMGMMGGMGGMGMGGMSGMDPTGGTGVKTTTALGKLYSLKKIYQRMSALHNLLVNTPDNEVRELTKIISESFDILKLIILNLKSYKDKADEIIVSYYTLIREVCKKLHEFYKNKESLREL